MPALDTLWQQHGETLGALLIKRAHDVGASPYLHLQDDAGAEVTYSFAEVYERAAAVAASLQAKGLTPGFRALLVLPTGIEFIATFFGILLAGGTAVPVYPPLRMKGMTDYQTRLSRLIINADPALIVTFRKVRLVVESAAYQARVSAPVVEPSALGGQAADFRATDVGAEAVALVQYSSGSTGHPRGVMLSHRNLLANLASVLAVIKPGPTDINCSWLPLYHDMGLIGGLLMPLFSGNALVLMSPQSFLLDPKRWLWAIHRHRATVSTAPNFAYQLVASRLDEQELAGLDLSSWRVALSGAEPVVPATMQAFARRLAPYGLDARAMTPVYGLAEVALGAIFPPLGHGAQLDCVDPAKLAAEGVASALNEAPTSLDLATVLEGAHLIPSVGSPLPGFEMRIADAEGRALPERRVGEIQLQGPSVMVGYLSDDAATAAAFQDGWLRTGDQGYIAGGQLFIVGRLKDLILRAGRNYAPQDLEQAAEQVDGVRKGCVAAFGVADGTTGTEAVVVVAETRQAPDAHPALARAITDRIFEALGLKPDHVALVPPGAVPKTSSGKLQRGRCRDHWQTDRLAAPDTPGMIDKTRVVGQALVQRALATPFRKGRPTRG